MKKSISLKLLSFFLFSFCFLFYDGLMAQSQEENDAIVDKICKEIEKTPELSDSLRIALAVQKHLVPFLAGLNERNREEAANNIYYRLQKKCAEFINILNRMYPPPEDWKIVDKKPSGNISKEDCKKLLEFKTHQYLEQSGDTTTVDFSKKFWVDKFTDGTWSKLEVEWLSDCEFELTFMKSNNETRKNLSKKGDKYRYTILEFKEGYYLISSEIVNSGKYYIFKLHVR